jgi:hypothetical protein
MASPRIRSGLPKLSTSQEISRRDSLSSARTRDSGYNSDLELAFSPLDYGDAEQRMLPLVVRYMVAHCSRRTLRTSSTVAGHLRR